MSLKFKVLGLGLLAVLSLSAMSVMNASAKTGGHFTSDVHHTTLFGTDHPTDKTEFTANGEGIRCPHATYHATVTGTTVTEITVTPTYGTCEHDLGPAHVTMNGCDYVFTIGKKAHEDNTTHLVCPGAGPEIHVTGPFGTCTITITPNQTPAGGVAYTTGTQGGKHDITVDVTVSNIHSELHGGFFLCGTGTTTHTGSLHGSATVEGKDQGGALVNITATGSEGT